MKSKRRQQVASPGKDHRRTMTTVCLVNIALVLPEHTILLGACSRHATDIPAVLGRSWCLGRRTPWYKAAAEGTNSVVPSPGRGKSGACVRTCGCAQHAVPQGPQQLSETHVCWKSTNTTYFSTAQEGYPVPSYAGCCRGN